jgi:tetratricopeptide (TPR) repeat protein
VAEGTYRAALNIYREQEHRLGEAQALDNLAGLALRRGRAGEAVETYRKSIAVYETLGAPQEVATTTYNLALGYKALGDTRAGLETLDRVLSSARDLKEQGLEAAALDQRGTIRAQEGDSDRAQVDYEQAVKLYEEQEDALGLATVKDHLAMLVAERGDYAAAEALRLEAVALFEKLGDAHELAVAWANLASLYVEMGAYDQAWDYAQRAHAVFERLGSAMQQVTAQLLTDLS